MLHGRPLRALLIAARILITLLNIAVGFVLLYRLQILASPDCRLTTYCDHVDEDEISMMFFLAGIALFASVVQASRWAPKSRVSRLLVIWSVLQLALYSFLIHGNYIVTYDTYIKHWWTAGP